MKTIKLKFDWTIEGLKKLHKNLSNSTYRPIQLTSNFTNFNKRFDKIF